MGNEYRAKVFKSGNSVALRLPKALGLKDGDEMVLREESGGLALEPASPIRRKFNVDKVAGSAIDLEPVADWDRTFRDRDPASLRETPSR